MPRTRFMLAGLLACALLLAACGADDESAGKLSAATAESLLAELTQIEQNALADNCTVADGHADTLALDVQLLPESVNVDLKRALINSVSRLKALLNSPEGCGSNLPPTEPPVTEPPTTTDTEPTDTTETETTETETDTETQPPGGGVGL